MADIAQRPIHSLPKQPKSGSIAGSPNVKKKATEAAEPVSSHIDDIQSQTHDATQTGTQNGDEIQTHNELETVDDEEGTEALGSVDEEGNVRDEEGRVVGHVTGEKAKELKGSMVDKEGDVLDAEGNVIGKADLVGEAVEAAGGLEKPEIEQPELGAPFGIQDNGEITNATGTVIGKLAEGTPQDLVGTSIKGIDAEGNLMGASGSIIGKGEIEPQLLEKFGGEAPLEGSQAPHEGKLGELGSEVPVSEKVDEATPLPEDAKSKVEGIEGSEGKLGEATSELPEDATKVDGAEDGLQEGELPAAELPDLSILKDKKVNKLGKIVDEEGTPFGQLAEGFDPKKLVGKKVDAEGNIWDDSGKIIGKAELLPEEEREAEPSAPFEDFPDSVLDKSGNVIFEGRIVGKLVEGDEKKLEGKKVDADGDVLDKNGNVLGRAERYQEEDEVPEIPEEADLSVLEGMKVNKAGNVVDENGKLFGRIISGALSKLIGKKVDKEGKIWSESGKVIGTAELIPVDERDEHAGAPFEDFPDAVVTKEGHVTYEGQIVGRLIEGDAKKLAGKKVDQDGEVVDRVGNVLGKAERWEPEEEVVPEPEKVDMSILAGKRVNKIGNVVDSHGEIYGRLVEGDPKKLAGKMCDKEGNVWSEGGNIVGRAELVPESERAGQKEGPFSGFDSAKVTKDGKVADAQGNIIGRLIEGDAKKLYGKEVDADGDVLDRNGNTLGRAERWEEEEKEKVHNPVAGRKVNREGLVVDENGDVIAKLTEGEIFKCSGKEIDEDGDVYNQKGQVIGHVTLLEEIPPEPEAEPEPEETEEEIEARKQLETDKKLAGQIAMCVQQSLDKINPILKMITEAIDAAERQPKEELDEQKLVDTVKPLIEQGGMILTEANGVIRGLDPDGRISANAKAKTASREATPEEYRLADVLKELTGNVTTTIDNAKKKIAGMPHAEKELNPLWGLLAEPLGQIIAAVGLLLSGVLGLVGNLLSGLGLGGLLDNLLGGLGLKGILSGLGLGSLTDALTGKKKGKK